jgi:hypothetical protein
MLSHRPLNHDPKSDDTGQSCITGQIPDVSLATTPTGLDTNVALDFGWRRGT